MVVRWSIAISFIVVSFAAMLAARSNASSTAVPPDIRAVFNKPLYKQATWGLRVLDGSRVLIDYNSDKQLFIGSVRKVFSVGQLLNTVGAAHTYNTPVYRKGTIDASKTLRGNLVLIASGDITMGGRANPDGTIAFTGWDHNEADSLGNAILTKPNPLAGYQKLAQQIKASGIDRVAGDVVIDDRLFVPFDFRGQFKVRPIYVNDDVVDATMTPGGAVGAPVNVATRPRSAALAIVNQLTNGAPNSKDTLAIDPVLPACIGQPGCSSAIKGSLPSNFTPPLTGGKTLVQTVRIVQPANYARTVFIEALAAAGVKVDAAKVKPNPVRLLPAANSYRAADKVAELTGMRYGQDAKFILKVSYNIGADSSLVLYGITQGVNTMPGALAVETKTLAARYGIPSSAHHFIDGSGGGDTTATNVAVTRMLEALAKAPEHQAFYDALPSLGVDGSLGFVKRFASNGTLAGAKGQVHAKTGTYVGGSAGGPVLKGQALGGYITTKSGKHLTFQLVVNNVPISGIPDVVKVFEDQGTIAATLWRDN